MNILLVQPNYPIPSKRKINHDFLPIGLLKIGTYLKHANNHEVRLVFGNTDPQYEVDEIWISSLFTYWSKYVKESVDYYRKLYPSANIKIGGIFASLMPDYCEKITGIKPHVGTFDEAERWCAENFVDYSLLENKVDFQILHGMRGCFRKCKFCGTWKIEPEMYFDRDIAKKVNSNHVVFYDNNFLKNDNIKLILKELAEKRVNGKHVIYESQSGFDGRILDQEIANLLKKARFINPRIAWDNSFNDWPQIEKQIDYLVTAGYQRKHIYVFILYNWEHPYSTVENKRVKCWEWGVQISDCRFRPLNQTYDNFNSKKEQTQSDYFIHEKWNDVEIKQFRKNVRRHNICVRHDFAFYSPDLEHFKIDKKEYLKLKDLLKNDIKKKLDRVWFPDDYTQVEIRSNKSSNLDDFLKNNESIK